MVHIPVDWVSTELVSSCAAFFYLSLQIVSRLIITTGIRQVAGWLCIRFYSMIMVNGLLDLFSLLSNAYYQ